jgi:hypothetical protein
MTGQMLGMQILLCVTLPVQSWLAIRLGLASQNSVELSLDAFERSGRRLWPNKAVDSRLLLD